MELIRGLHNLRDRHRGCVLSIGNFDGLHRGHQALLARLKEHAARLGLPVAVQIQEPTPREFFAPDTAPGRVLSFRQKLWQLEAAGVERLLCVHFDSRFAAMEASAYVEHVLADKLGAKAVVVGDDVHFGCGRGGGLALLQELGRRHGFVAEGLSTVTVDGLRCSSTAVREALAQPDLALAARLLGRPYRIAGRVRRGLQLGRKLGMPTANIELHRRPALHLGVYAVRAYARGSVQAWPGVASIGVRPTLGLTRCLLETHLFEDVGPLYGREMEVEFCRYLRPEERFESLDALAVQMQADRVEAQRFFASMAPPVGMDLP